jgi:hypothetical protein
MKQTQKRYLTFIIFTGLFIALVILVTTPLFEGIKKNSLEFESVRKEIVSLEAEIGNIGKIKKQYQEYEPNLGKIDSLLVNSEIPIDFIRFLEKLASDSMVSIDISLASNGSVQKEEDQLWPALYFQLSTQSSYLNIVRFIEKLENSPHLIEIQKLSINKKNDKEGAKDVSAEILIKVFAK